MTVWLRSKAHALLPLRASIATLILIAGGMLLLGCAATPAGNVAQLQALRNSLAIVEPIANAVLATTTPPAWAPVVFAAEKAADDALAAAVLSVQAGDPASATVLLSAETAVGDLIGVLLSHGVAVPAAATQHLAEARGLHAAGPPIIK